MKMKKMLSILTAAALATSSMAGLAVSASAAELPADKAWTTADSAWVDAVNAVTANNTAISEYNGLSGYGAWTPKDANVTYTHTNGAVYKFTKSLQAGSGGTNNRCFYFTPETTCIVTVAYSAQSGRPMYIVQGGKILASGEEGLTGGAAATISYDIDDPSKGDVYVYGGSSNKQLYGIFVDYYDPNQVVYRKVSGNINYNGPANTSAMKIVFEDTTDQTKYEAAFGQTYSVDLRQNRSYDVYVTENGTKSGTVCTALDTNSVSVAKIDKTFDIDVVDVAATEVTGDVVVHDVYNDGTTLDLSKVSLTFTAQDNAEYTYTTGITNNKIAVTMEPNHTYNITASGNDGYELSALSGTYTMPAGEKNPFKNILFTETVSSVDFKDTVEVGSDKEFATITDAITAVKKMSRASGEEGRVTVLVYPGTYTEQVMVDTGYVTIKAADEANKPKVEWYYGIGYIYYSSAGNGYYSRDYAVAKTKKGTVQRWGPTIRITGSYVLLENIIFENTFSGRVTDAEIADGVEAAKNNEYSDVNGKPERNVENYDASSRSAVERAAAIALDCSNAEVYKCEFISSQDTFYTGGSAYIKDCYIEGCTDYIFGGNSVVFDGCTLAWHGYSDQLAGGYITANKNSSVFKESDPTTYGYLFIDSTVTNSKYYTDNKFAPGSWGRNWGGAATRVFFDGVRMDGVDVPGAWSKMGGELNTSILYVENVTDKNGAAVDTSGETFNPNGTMAANSDSVDDPTVYFGAWVPVHYDGEIPVPKEDVTVTYSIGDTGAAGTVPESATVTEGKTTTIPKNRTLYIEGKTLTGWTDSTNTYAVGQKITVNADMTLTPVFEDNTEEPLGTVEFNFRRDQDAPVIASQNAKGIYVGQSSNGIDVKLDYDTNNGGKLNNANNGDWIQCNAGTKFTLPVVDGSVISLGDVYKADITYTINGTEKTGGNQSETVKGQSTADIVITGGTQNYIRTISVTYPASEQAEFSDLRLDLMNLSSRAGGENEFLTADEVSKKTGFTVGVTSEGKRTTESAANSIATLSGKYHSEEHGINPTSLVVAVPGAVKITVGTCAWGGQVTIKDAGGNTVDTINSNTGACYHQNKEKNVVSTYYKVEEPTTLTISGGAYWPYIAVEKVDVSDIPNDATITFTAGSASGQAPAAITADIGTKVKIPANRTLYIEGKTLTGWTDGTKTYAVGDNLTIANDVTLTPVFENNTEEPSGSVTFDFQQKNGAPVLNYGTNKTGFYVGQSTNGIDVKIDFETGASGKIANGNWQDWAQINSGTKFIFPAAKGTVITVDNFYPQNSSKTVCTINGTVVKSDDASYDVTIDSDTIAEIVIGECSYYRTISVAYPTATAPEIYVSTGTVYDDDTDSPAAIAFTADIAMGTASVESLTWTATDTATGKSASKDTAAPKITDGSVTYGLVVVLEDAGINPANVKAELTAK